MIQLKLYYNVIKSKNLSFLSNVWSYTPSTIYSSYEISQSFLNFDVLFGLVHYRWHSSSLTFLIGIDFDIICNVSMIGPNHMTYTLKKLVDDIIRVPIKIIKSKNFPFLSNMRSHIPPTLYSWDIIECMSSWIKVICIRMCWDPIWFESIM